MRCRDCPFSATAVSTRSNRILSRTVSYTVLVARSPAPSSVAVTLLTSIVESESDLVTAATTLLVASLFNPMRKRVQAWVDRRFNRSRYDAQRVMDHFAESLRDQVDSDEVMTGWSRGRRRPCSRQRSGCGFEARAGRDSSSGGGLGCLDDVGSRRAPGSESLLS